MMANEIFVRLLCTVLVKIFMMAKEIFVRLLCTVAHKGHDFRKQKRYSVKIKNCH